MLFFENLHFGIIIFHVNFTSLHMSDCYRRHKTVDQAVAETYRHVHPVHTPVCNDERRQFIRDNRGTWSEDGYR